jgi:ABC-type transport system substrate-binding protein
MIRALLLFGLSLTLAACSKGIDNSRLRVDVITQQQEPFAIGKLPLPQESAYLRSATAQGLVAFDKQGRIIPALASRWIVTDDGMSYIFRLEKTTWNDGTEVSSDDAAVLLNMRIKELANSRFGQELAVIDRVVAMTGKVVEIRLKAPAPNLLEVLAQPEFGLVKKGSGSGPMQARKYGAAMRLQLRETNDIGKTTLREEQTNLYRNSAAAALARFKTGDTDMVTGGKFQHLPLLEAANIPGGRIQFDPVPGLFGFIFANAGPFLSDRGNREAIAMAIDRPKMLSSFGVLAWQEAVTIAPEALQNRASVPRPDWAALRIKNRKARALQIINGWKSGNGSVRPLRIGLPDGTGSRILFARLQSDLAEIGLHAIRVSLSEKPDLMLIDRVADMSTPSWYLNQLSCRNMAVCDKEADALVTQAQNSASAAQRQELLGEAEAKLQSARNFIPLGSPVRWSVTRDGLLGFVANPRGWHLLQYLGRDTI